MIFKPSNYLLSLGLLISLFACSHENAVELIDTNFDQVVELEQNLNFVFSKALVGDTVLNFWDTTSYIRFKPEIPGRFKWYSEAVLIFSPSSALRPATSYSATVTKLLTKSSGLEFIGESVIKFSTPSLMAETANVFWKTDTQGETNANIVLNFNYPVSSERVVDKIKIIVDGQSRKVVAQESVETSKVFLQIPDIAVADRDINLKVIIDPGLEPIGGNIGSDQAFERELTLKSPFSVDIEDVMSEHNGVKGILDVQISQQAADDVKKFISISPTVDFALETTDTGLRIKSEDFDLRRKYSLVLRKGLKGKFGGALKSDYQTDISFGELEPSIVFANGRGRYLSRKGSQNLEVKIVNVDKVQVQVTKLYENNIMNFTNDSYYDYETGNYNYYFYNLSKQGDVVWEKTIDTKMLPKHRGFRLLDLSEIEDDVRAHKGMYAVKVFSNEKYWINDQRLMTISDLGLVVKNGKNDVTVFVNSINSAKPVSGVELRFIGSNNQLMGTASTDGNGVAIFKKKTGLPENFKLSLVTASLGDDYNVLNFHKTAVNTSKFDIGGKYPSPTGYDIFLYGDRDIYRPGETIRVAGILRHLDWRTPSAIPIKIKFFAPNGKAIRTIQKTLNKYGSFETSLGLGAAAPTGSYSAQVYTGNDVYLTSKYIQVEEFMPDRIKVEVGVDKTDVDLGDPSKIDITATNYFGPPAANRNYEVSISAKRKYFYTKEYSDYDFSIEGVSSYFQTIDNYGETDEEGRASMVYQLASEYKNMGLVVSDVYVTVFDETGRPVNRKRSITTSTQDIYVGVASDRYYTATNNEIRFPIITLDKNGKFVPNAKVRLKLIKHEFKTVLSRSGSYFRYDSEKVEKTIDAKEIPIVDENEFYSYIPDESGRYELRLYAPGSNNYVSAEFYAYGWGSTSNSSFEVNSEGQIDIALDKEAYQPGEQANVIMKSPFSGTILVTVETNTVLKHFYVDTDKRATSFKLDIEEDFVPNVYLTATLFKPHEQSDLPLTIAHGAAPVIVKNPKNKMDVSVTAAQSSRSNTTQTIKVKAAANAAVSVAVVDEGILAITGFETPDPYDHFYSKRALQVKSYDIYPFLFPEIDITTGSLGGGAYSDLALGKRVNPLSNDRVKLVTFWSGILETNGSGNAEFQIDIPQFSGNLRVMAVAHKDHTFGSAQSSMQVADPMVISVALPRFMSPGDTAIMPVTLSNTTDKNTKAKSSVSVSGPLSIVGNKNFNADVGAKAESVVTYKLVADQAIGQANVSITADALGEYFKNNTDIPIRPASPLQKQSGSGVIKAGSTESINMSADNFIEESVERKLVISRSPMVEFAKDLDYLIRYPYGCVEQTVSSVFPQLYFQDLSMDVLGYGDENPNPNQHIVEAIKKLQLMQLYHGGLTYWPGGGYESWWGSVYAARFLCEAKQAGFDVDEGMYKALLDYLVTKLKSKKTISYYYNNSSNRTIAAKEIPYSLYVLALAGKPQRATMNYYKNNAQDLALDGKYLLAAAYKLIGDDKRYRGILPQAFDGERSNTSRGGSFYSYIRDLAIALNVMLEVDADNPQVATMARQLSQQMRQKRYLNTQERAFGFLALGKVARRNASNTATAEILVGGKKVQDYKNKTLTFKSNELVGGQISVKTGGSGSLYYSWELEGISSDGSYREEDSFIKVRKKFYDRSGNLITSNEFNQNDLIVVNLSLVTQNGEYVENVAMTDILPAGFEIENSRISDVPDINWIKNAVKPDYLDVRDDRIIFFTHAGGSEQNYYYVVRAVSKGTFQMGPVGADAMYDGAYHSYSGGGVVKVK